MSINPSDSRDSALDSGLQALRQQRAHTSRWKLPWGGVLLTVVLAGTAAFVGARLGSDQAQVRTTPLSDRVFDVLENVTDLTPPQRASIDRIGGRYASVRAQLRQQSRMLNVTLARLMAEENGLGPKTEATLAQLQVVMGERLKLSMEYMLEVRQVLTTAQRRQFDRRVEEEASVSR
jgi:Spy/CpxP family protein refolding chaperone